MSEEEIREFLKKNLSIRIEHTFDMYEAGFKVVLTLDNEDIAEDYFVCDTKD